MNRTDFFLNFTCTERFTFRVNGHTANKRVLGVAYLVGKGVGCTRMFGDWKLVLWVVKIHMYILGISAVHTCKHVPCKFHVCCDCS